MNEFCMRVFGEVFLYKNYGSFLNQFFCGNDNIHDFLPRIYLYQSLTCGQHDSASCPKRCGVNLFIPVTHMWSTWVGTLPETLWSQFIYTSHSHVVNMTRQAAEQFVAEWCLANKEFHRGSKRRWVLKSPAGEDFSTKWLRTGKVLLNCKVNAKAKYNGLFLFPKTKTNTNVLCEFKNIYLFIELIKTCRMSFQVLSN